MSRFIVFLPLLAILGGCSHEPRTVAEHAADLCAGRGGVTWARAQPLGDGQQLVAMCNDGMSVTLQMDLP